MTIQTITTDKISPSPNPFSLGVKANGFLFVSGQIGKEPTGKLAESFPAQVRQAMENLKVIVEAAGTSMDQIVKVTIYVTDITRMPELNDIYREYFPKALPARAAMEISKLGLGAEVEIDAIVQIS